MVRYIAILAVVLFVAGPSLADELDAEFGAKKVASAPSLKLPSNPIDHAAKSSASELDKEAPAQARRCGWGGGWGGGWGWGWRGGWGGWCGWRGGWGGWGGGWGGWRGGWCGWPSCSFYAWPTYAYWGPSFSIGYPGWRHCW